MNLLHFFLSLNFNVKKICFFNIDKLLLKLKLTLKYVRMNILSLSRIVFVDNMLDDLN